MDNVVQLPGQRSVVQDEKPVEPLVLMLKSLLADAESGRLRAFIGVGVNYNGHVVNLWCDTWPNVYTMMGAIEWMKLEYAHRLTSQVMEPPNG